MTVNNGQIELYALLSDGEVRVTVQYDNTGPADPTQPLVNRNGQCLQATNTTGRVLQATVNAITFNVPARTNLGRSAQQMAQQGFSTRGDIATASWVLA